MKKPKIIPYRILTSNSSEDAKLMVTNRKETKIFIKAKAKPSIQISHSICANSDDLISPQKPSTSQSSRPYTQGTSRKSTQPLFFSDLTSEQLNFLKTSSCKSAENLQRLQKLHWEMKLAHPALSPSFSAGYSLPQETPMLSPAILPKVYSFRPFLMPFINAIKPAKEEVDIILKSSSAGFIRVFWSIKDTFGDRPNGREGCQLIVLKNQVFMFGGQSRIKHTEVRILEPSIWTWRILGASYTPQGRLGHSLVQFKGKIVLYGGQSQHSQNLGIRRCSRKVFYMSVNKKKWQHYAGEGEMPEARRHHAAAGVGKFMVIYGGMNQQGHILSDLYLFDMKQKKWFLPEVTVEKDPGPRSHASLTSIFDQAQRENYTENIFKLNVNKGKIEFLNSGFYLFGGLSSEGVVTNSLHGLYIRDGKLVWTLMKNVSGTPPSPRCNHSACAVKHRLFIFGGRNDELFKFTGDSALNDLFSFNVATLRWENIRIQGSIPEGRWGHCMVALGNRVLMLGGLTTKHYMPADLYIMDIEKESNNTNQEEVKNNEIPIYSLKERRKTLKTLESGDALKIIKLL